MKFHQPRIMFKHWLGFLFLCTFLAKFFFIGQVSAIIFQFGLCDLWLCVFILEIWTSCKGYTECINGACINRGFSCSCSPAQVHSQILITSGTLMAASVLKGTTLSIPERHWLTCATVYYGEYPSSGLGCALQTDSDKVLSIGPYPGGLQTPLAAGHLGRTAVVLR